MALFFKRLRPTHRPPASRAPKREEKPKEIKEEKPLETVEVRPPQAKREKVIGEAYRILKTPQVTEKATDLVKKNQYVFKVSSRANKNEVKKAIESVYGVDVISVRIINVPAKRRRLGRQRGWRKGYKKAIVKIKTGQKIEVLPR